jgi:hypothetical protein
MPSCGGRVGQLGRAVSVDDTESTLIDRPRRVGRFSNRVSRLDREIESLGVLVIHQLLAARKEQVLDLCSIHPACFRGAVVLDQPGIGVARDTGGREPWAYSEHICSASGRFFLSGPVRR